MVDDWNGDHEKTAIIRADQIQGKEETAHAALLVINGSNVGALFRVDHAMLIGRAYSADVRLKDPGISRRHCRVVPVGNQIFIEDLESTNGTLVNGEKVERTLLQDGDRVQVGTTAVLKFSYHDTIEENFQRQMYDAALRDSLVKTYNKRFFAEALQSEFSYSQRHNSLLSLIMFDIDRFKKVNDTHGHLAGDYVLAQIGRGVGRMIRTEDILARYGGEEFAILARGIDLPGAEAFAERIRLSIEKTDYVYQDMEIPITISIGVATIPDETIEKAEQLVERTDKALYRAKEAGRNRVVVAPSGNKETADKK